MIEVEGLSKRFGRTQAVSNLSFRVEPGTITGFLGPNGAGKSTTLRSVLGLVRPDAGRAAVLGVPYRDLDRPLHRVGAVLEASEVHPGRSGRNHLRVLAAAVGVPRSRVEEVLALVELTAAATRRVKGYSLGMRQRLGLAAALIRPRGARARRAGQRPRPRRRPLVARPAALARRGGPDDPRLEPRPRRGRADGRPRRDHPPRHARPAGLDRRGAGRRAGCDARALAAEGAAVTASGGDGLVLDVAPERVGEVAAANGVVLHELGVESATLEEVFLELTRGETTE